MKGKYLEQIVKIIEFAYKDNPNTQIYSNYEILSKSGVKREFDIFIVSAVNNYTINIAIECKEYSRKVGVDKIEAFKQKCETVGGISKMVFISKKGFQSGALREAGFHQIELKTLNELNPENIKNWHLVDNNYALVIKNKELLEVFFEVSKDFNAKKEDNVYVKGVTPIHPIKYILSLMNMHGITQKILNQMQIIHLLSKTSETTEVFNIAISLPQDEAYFIRNNIKIEIIKITFKFKLTMIEEKIKPKVMSLKDALTENEIAKILTIENSIEDENYNLIFKNETDTLEIINHSIKRNELTKLEITCSLDPETGKITYY